MANQKLKLQGPPVCDDARWIEGHRSALWRHMIHPAHEPLEAKLPLTPTQWLPKPATSQLPSKRCALRALWSPFVPQGAREKTSHRQVHGRNARNNSGRSLQGRAGCPVIIALFPAYYRLLSAIIAYYRLARKKNYPGRRTALISPLRACAKTNSDLGVARSYNSRRAGLRVDRG